MTEAVQFDKRFLTNTIENALLALASTDTDYARLQNEVGFNAFDTAFGNSLADQVKAAGRLSVRQKVAAFKMLRTYKKQLLRNWGIEYDLIPNPNFLADSNIGEPEEVKGRLVLVDGRCVLDTTWNRALVDQIRGLPIRSYGEVPGFTPTYNRDSKAWSCPVVVDNVPALLKLAEDWKLELQPEDRAVLESSVARLEANIAKSQATEALVEVPGLGVTLRPFQSVAVAYTRENMEPGKGIYIADEMGLGKTIEALAILEDNEAYPALIAVPKVVWLNWARECRKVLPDRKPVLLSPRSTSAALENVVPKGTWLWRLGDSLSRNRGLQGSALLPKADIYIVNYENITRWQEILTEHDWSALVLDEAHLIKERKSKRTVVVRDLGKKIKLKVALSGTPVPNRPAELISQLQFLDRLDEVGGWKTFWNYHCQGWQQGAKDMEGLNRKMRSTFYIRRTVEDVFPELPEKRWMTVPMEMANPARYFEVENSLLAWITDKVAKDKEFAAYLEQMADEMATEGAELEDIAKAIEDSRQSYVTEKDQRARGAEALVKIEAMKQTAVEEKLESVKEWVREWIEVTEAQGKKLILFTDHRDQGFDLAQTFEAPFIVGGMKPELKTQYEDRFQADPTCRLIVCAIKAAGLGITLTAAEDVAFVEIPWRPMDMDQAVSRAYGRVNDPHGVTAYQLVAGGTIEDRIMDLIGKKRDVTGKAQDGSSVAAAVLKDVLRGKVRPNGD